MHNIQRHYPVSSSVPWSSGFENTVTSSSFSSLGLPASLAPNSTAFDAFFVFAPDLRPLVADCIARIFCL